MRWRCSTPGPLSARSCLWPATVTTFRCLQHLRRQARQVKVVGFCESVSGDLLQMLGQEHFIDARELMPVERLQALEDHRAARLRLGQDLRHLREQGMMGVQSAAARQAAQDAAATQ